MDGRVVNLIQYFAHDTTPERPQPGLGLNYSATVGALFQIAEHGGVDALFWPESDRLQLELARLADAGDPETRPELSDDESYEWTPPDLVTLDEAEKAAAEAGAEPDPEREERRRRYVIPLTPATPPAGAPQAEEPEGP